MSGRAPRAARLVAEFGAIVLGVLVALGGEAWWQDRQDAAQERENLGVLAGDLLATDTILGRVIREDSTFTEMIVEDLAALQSADTSHVLRLPLTVSDYRTRTGGLNRLLASPGPTLEETPELMALLSDLQAEIRLVEDLNSTMTAELFRYVQGTVQAQEEIRVSEGPVSPGRRVAALSDRPDAVASITMVMVILRNRDALHRRLRGLVGEVRAAVREVGGEGPLPAEDEPAPDREGETESGAEDGPAPD